MTVVLPSCAQGGFVYVGAGGAWFTGCPVIDFVAIKHASGIGGHVAVSGASARTKEQEGQ